LIWWIVIDTIASFTQFQGDFCLFYEAFPSLECETLNQQYGYALLNSSKLNRKCGGFTKGSSFIAACFCNSDNCNHIGRVKEFISGSVAKPSISSNVLTWRIIKDAKQQISLLECLRDNMVSMGRKEEFRKYIVVPIRPPFGGRGADIESPEGARERKHHPATIQQGKSDFELMILTKQ
ncbi:hypothetical protein COOONC_07362, partial [Cooperia oncophora]